jgi:hypothetical protein
MCMLLLRALSRAARSLLLVMGTRPCLIRAQDASGLSVIDCQRAIDLDTSDSFEEVFASLELPGRSLLEIKVLPFASSAASEATIISGTKLRDTIAESDESFLAIGLPLASLIIFIASSAAPAPVPDRPRANALQALLSSGQAASAAGRTPGGAAQWQHQSR